MKIDFSQDDIVRNIDFNGEVSASSVSGLISKIRDINKLDERLEKQFNLEGYKYIRKPINVTVNSFGGCAYNGLAAYDAIKASIAPVDVHVSGTAMSAALMLVLAGRNRSASESSVLMYHGVSSFNWGTLETFKEEVSILKSLQKSYDKKIVENTKLSRKELKKIVSSKKDFHISSKKAVKLGFIHEVI